MRKNIFKEIEKNVIISYNKNLIFGGMKYGKID